MHLLAMEALRRTLEIERAVVPQSDRGTLALYHLLEVREWSDRTEIRGWR